MTQAKWTIPDTLDPIDTVCVQVQVPKDDKHIAAFWGALGALQYSWNWQDSYGNGSVVAYVWRDVIETAVMAVRNGTNCDMPIDCAEVEACLATSAIIANLQAQITANDGDITNLEAADITLQNNIDTNTAGLAAHGIRITDNENDIASLQLDAAAQAILIQANTDNIALNDIELADHEARISVLEAAGGGGGGGSGTPQMLRTQELIETNVLTQAEAFVDIDIPAGYTELYIQVHAACDDLATNRILQLFYNDDLVVANYRSAIIGGAAYSQPYIGYLPRGASGAVGKLGFYEIRLPLAEGGKERIAHVVAAARLTPTANPTHHDWTHIWQSNAAITKVRLAPTASTLMQTTIINVWGVKEQEVLVPSVVPCDTYQALDVVDFDNNICYALPVGQMGTIEANGNPNNCLWMDNPVTDDYIEVEIDMGQNYDIGVVQYDVIADQAKSISRKIWIDDVLIWDSSGNFNDATWHTYQTPDSNTIGQVVRVRVDVNEAHTRIGLDNIEIGII